MNAGHDRHAVGDVQDIMKEREDDDAAQHRNV